MRGEKLVGDQDTIVALTGKIQELQNEINCMNDSRDFQDAGAVRSGNSHVSSRLVSFSLHPIPGGMLSRSKGMPSRKDKPPSIWDTHGISGNVFASPVVSSAAPSGISEPIHSSTTEKMRIQQQFKIRDASPDRQPKIQSSLVRGDSSKNFWCRPATTAGFRS